jgi:hypothetical protein
VSYRAQTRLGLPVKDGDVYTGESEIIEPGEDVTKSLLRELGVDEAEEKAMLERGELAAKGSADDAYADNEGADDA